MEKNIFLEVGMEVRENFHEKSILSKSDSKFCENKMAFFGI